MGTSDGSVLGTTKLVDHGPDTARWNLVIVGDGYRSTEMATYHTDVENFLSQLRNSVPFKELFCGINVYRIDVTSTQSGADDPGCGGNPAVTAATYFDATYCSMWNGSPLERLLTVDSGSVLSVVTARVPLRHQVICIVNSMKYGGSGGSIATCASGSPQVALHEMCHSAFGLADEYGGNGAATPAGEFVEPNVTRDTNRATNKWRALIAATTPMPSQCNAACASSSCVSPATPPAPGAVGTYEGGKYADCNTYRPLPDCRMRSNGTPLCPVCAGVVRATLLPFQPAESITLVTTSISFTNVPSGMGGVGVTTHRAIRWDVVTCRDLTFRVVAGPTSPFVLVTTSPVTVTADPIVPTAAARIWIAYTSTDPGDTAAGTIRVRCNETGMEWLINIVANTVSRPRTAVSLVIDRSGSMNDDAGDATTKVAKVREAANVFISAMLPDDGIGIVRFNDSAQRLMEIQAAGASPGGAGRSAALGHTGSDINPTGGTSIGDGVVKGKQMLDDAQADPSPDYDVTAMVLLTDGQWNVPPSLATVSGSITANTFAVGFGLPSNISVPALTTLTGGHNGYLLITGAISSDQSMRLSKYFLQILAGVTNAQIAADPSGVLYKGAEHRIPFHICEADFGMDLFVLSPAPYFIDFQLEAPDGTRITPASGGMGANSQFVMSRYASYYRCALPVLPADPAGSHVGTWHAVLKLGKRARGDNPNNISGQFVPYEFVAHTYSALTFSASVSQASFEIGAVAKISARILEYDAEPRGRANIWAEIRRPDGTPDVISFAVESTGRYSASYGLPQAGVYTFRVRARGETMHGTPFEREQTLTAVAVHGGDHWDPNEPKRDPICELLDCLRRHGGLNDELIRRLKALGIDIEAVLKCFELKCRGTANAIETRDKTPGRLVASTSLAAFTAEQINALTAEVIRILGRND